MSKEKVKKPFYKRVWVWVIAIVIVIGIASIGGDDTDSAKGNSDNMSKTEDTDASKEKKDKKDKSARIGEPATVGDVTFTVNGVEETSEIDSGSEFVENATTSGKYVILDVTVKNEKDESITVDSSFFKINADGTEFEPNTDGGVMMAMGEAMSDFFLTQINPDIEKSGKVVFEVSKDIDLSKAVLQAQTGAFGTEKTEISLSE